MLFFPIKQGHIKGVQICKKIKTACQLDENNSAPCPLLLICLADGFSTCCTWRTGCSGGMCLKWPSSPCSTVYADKRPHIVQPTKNVFNQQRQRSELVLAVTCTSTKMKYKPVLFETPRVWRLIRCKDTEMWFILVLGR